MVNLVINSYLVLSFLKSLAPGQGKLKATMGYLLGLAVDPGLPGQDLCYQKVLRLPA